MCSCIFCPLLLDVMQSFLISFMCSFYFVFFTLYPFILFSIVFIFFKLVLFFCLWLHIFFLIQSRLDVSSAIYFQKETYTLNRLVCFFSSLFFTVELFVLSLFAKGKTPAFNSQSTSTVAHNQIFSSNCGFSSCCVIICSLVLLCFTGGFSLSCSQKLTLTLNESFFVLLIFRITKNINMCRIYTIYTCLCLCIYTTNYMHNMHVYM